MTKTKSTVTRKKKVESAAGQQTRAVTPEERYRMIAEAAYFLAEKRGFVDGDVAEDWLAAEAEIDRILQLTKENDIIMTTHEIEQQVQAALRKEPAVIADKVRAITLQALSGGELDREAIKRVISAVVAGARQGAGRAEQGAQALKEAMHGLDDALASAAEATQLAIQEAAGRSGEFSKQALKKTADDLAALESLFIETLADAAKSATGFARATLRDFANHARASGTATGGRVKSALAQLTHTLADTMHEQLETGAQALRKEGALLASLAAGMLKGIADRLQWFPGNKTANSPPAKRRDH